MPNVAKEVDLDHMRHSCAHVLAQAMLSMFPEAKLGVGPTVEHGFYYDFELPRTLIPEDLEIVEKKMQEIVKQNQKFVGRREPIAKAIKFLEKINQPFKIDLVEQFQAEGEKEVSFYENVLADGTPKFVDLCRGGHVESTGDIGAFKLDKIAGAYWRGDVKNPVLQRVYGLCFATKKELADFLHLRAEAERRDHRKLGLQLDLFTFSALVGGGLPLFTPKGTQMRRDLENFVQSLQEPLGFQRVQIPHITRKELYETSGHWEKFKNDLFHVKGFSEDEFAMKPMNCPHHTQIYASRPRSYRDLPLRYSEVTMVYRDEQTGELHGLSRVRAITQDDAHVFCRANQIMDECIRIYGIVEEFYKVFGMELKVRLSVRDLKQPEKYLGDPELWKVAEAKLQEVLDKVGVTETLSGVGEAAFYGPKIDFMAYDALGREWQLATIQLDFVQPERFKLTYTDSDGQEKRPIMIHRAISGSLERFMSVLIEHFAGAFPLWLAPVQVAVIPIAQAHEEYARQIFETLKEKGVRAEILAAEDTLGKRIRAAETGKVNYMLVIGEKEMESESVAVRNYHTKKQTVVKFDEFLADVLGEIRERRRP